MIGGTPDDVPVVLCRFETAEAAVNAIDALLEGGIASASIDGPTPRTFALAVKVAGRSDRHFIAETLRELGADVRIVEPAPSE